MRKYKLSLGVSQGKVSELHSRRTYCPPSAEASLMSRNVHVIDPRNDDGSIVTYREQVNEMFAGAIDRYNAKQRRTKLKKSHDYYEEIDSSKRKEKPVYSTLLQLGNRDTCGVTDVLFDAKRWKELRKTDPDAAAAYVQQHLDDRPQRRAAKECLIDICEQFQQWYPNLQVVSIVIHDDEPDGTCHADINWCPVAGGEGSGTYKGGLDTRCALNKALEQMGFNGRGYDFAIKHWQADFKTRCEQVMLEHDIEREYMNNTDKHKDIATYKIEREREEESMKLAEIKRRQEVARLVEQENVMAAQTAQARREELEDREAELERRVKKAKKRVAKAEARAEAAEAKAERAESRAERAEARAEAAEARVDEAREDVQDARDEAASERAKADRARREADAVAENIKEKKKRLEVIENLIKQKFDEAQKMRKQLHDLTRDVMNMSRVMNMLTKPLETFRVWLREFSFKNPDKMPEQTATKVITVMRKCQKDYELEVGNELIEALRMSAETLGEEDLTKKVEATVKDGALPAAGRTGKNMSPVKTFGR